MMIQYDPKSAILISNIFLIFCHKVSIEWHSNTVCIRSPTSLHLEHLLLSLSPVKKSFELYHRSPWIILNVEFLFQMLFIFLILKYRDLASLVVMIKPDFVKHITSLSYIILRRSLDFHIFSCLPLPVRGSNIRSEGLSDLYYSKILYRLIGILFL